MKRTILSRGSIILVLLMLFNTISFGYSGTMNTYLIASENEAAESTVSNGNFNFYIKQNREWKFIDSIEADEYFRDYFIEIPDEIKMSNLLRMKIEKAGGGLAHIDWAEAAGYSTLANLKPDHELSYKLTAADKDVIEVTEEGIVITFEDYDLDASSKNGLHINGRIEPKALWNKPFTYPRGNDTDRMTSGSNFYVYDWDSNYGSNEIDGNIEAFDSREPLFELYDMPGTGHPDGYTYGWVMNDDQYLYAVIDFTPDNTFDDDKDYASLFIDTAEGVKQFTVSESNQIWGRPAFTYTSKVGYQHKVYEFKIPISELDNKDTGEIRISFSAYGTAAQPETIDTDVAYASSVNEYMMAFQMTDSGTGYTAIFTQRFDYSGTPIGPFVPVVPFSQMNPSHPKVEYNSVDDQYLVVWDALFGGEDRILGMLVDVDGTPASGEVFLDTLQYQSIPGSRTNPDVTYSKDNNTFAVVWKLSDFQLEGSVVSGISPSSALAFNPPLGGIGAFEMSYNSTRYTHTIVYSMLNGGETGIYYDEFTKYGGRVSLQTRVSPVGETPLIQPNVTHNILENDEYVTWIDSSSSSLQGMYKNVSGSAIEFTSNVYVGDRATAVSKGQMKDEILVVWSEVMIGDGTFGTLYADILDDMGNSLLQAPDMIFNDMGAIDNVSAVSNGQDGYLITFAFYPDAGSPLAIAVHYGSTSSGDVEFKNISVDVNEGSTASLIIERTGGVDGDAAVDYTMSNVTADASDYDTTSGTAIILDGQSTETITIATVDDSIVEGTESFEVTLSNLQGGGQLLSNITATVNIIDNDSEPEVDPPIIEFDPTTSFTVAEGGSLDIALSRTGDLNGSVSVDYETISGTAGGTDYVYDQGTIIFGDQVSTQSIEVSTLEDNTVEPSESFTLVLSSPSGATIGTNDTATITITDDDSYVQEGRYDPDVAYASSTDQYLVVYEVYDGVSEGSAIAGQFYDNTGAPVGSEFIIEPSSVGIPWMPVVIYNSTDDEFLVAWNELVGEVGDITYFTILDGNGNILVASQPVTPEVDEVHFGLSGDYNPVTNSYCLVWEYEDYGTYEMSVAGILFDSSRTISPLGMTPVVDAFNPHIVYNSTGNTYDVAFTYINGGKSEIRTSIFDGNSGSAISENEVLIYSTDNQHEPLLYHNSIVEDDYVVWGESGTTDRMIGQYKTASGTAIEITSGNVDLGTEIKPKSLMDLSGMRVFWIHKDAELLTYSVMTQKINDEGTITESAVTLDTDPESFNEISSAYDFEQLNHLVAYEYDTTSGSSLRVALVSDGDVQEPVVSTQISMASSTAAASEGEDVIITVTRTGEDLSGTDTVEYSTSDGTAGSSDYTGASGTLTFGSGESAKTITVSSLEDVVVEGDESFTVSLSNPAGDASLVSPTSTVVTISDDDAEIYLRASTETVSEGDMITVYVDRAGDRTGIDTIDYALVSGTADDTDYETISGVLTFASGDSTKSISISTVDDTLDEEDESFSVVLSNPVGSAVLGAQDTSTVTIIDNDEGTEINLNSSVETVSEGDTITVYVNRTGNLSGIDTIDYALVSGTADDTDYIDIQGTLTFSSGDSSKNISISTIDDTLDEADESFSVVLSNPVGNALLGTQNVSAVTITDNDADSVIGFASEVSGVTEGDSTIINVYRSGYLEGIDSVDYTVTHATTTSADLAEASGTLTFAAGETEQIIEVVLEDDTVIETEETFTVALSNPAGNAALGSVYEMVVTVVDDDETTTIGMSSSVASVQEGESAQVVVVRSAELGNLTSTDTIDYTVTTGTAGGDDITEETGTIIFESGETSYTIEVATTDDYYDESNETFTVTLSDPTGNAVLGTDVSTLVTIIDDDIASEISMSLETTAVEEGGQANVLVQRTGNLLGTDTVQYATIYGTADISDFTAQSGTLTFSSGEVSKTINIDTTSDFDIEDSETFSVTLSQPTDNAVIGTLDTTSVTIVDNDYSVSFDVSELSISEGSTGSVTVVREGYSIPIDVHYDLTLITASSNDVSGLNGTLSFAEGETSKVLSIPTIDDSKDESIEKFFIEITVDSSNYIGENNVLTVSIIDNDKRKDDDEPVDEPADTGTDSSSGGGDSQDNTTADIVSDTNAKDELKNLADSFKETIASSEEEPITNNVAEAILDVMESNLAEIQDEEILSEALTSYVETIESITQIVKLPVIELESGAVLDPEAELAAKEEQRQWVEKQVVEITDVVSKSIQKINDDTKVVEVAKNVVGQLKQIEITTEAKQTVGIKNQVAELAQSVLTKVSEVKVEHEVEVVEGVSEVKFDEQVLADTVAKKAENFKTLSDSFNEFYGEDNVREFDFEVTLVTERVADQMKVPIGKETIKTLNAAGVDALSVAVGGTTVTIDKEIYSDEIVDGEVVEAPEMVVDMNFNDQGFEVRDERVNFKKGIVTDVRVFLDEEETKKLEKPVELKFNVGDFEFWEEDYNPSSLSIFRLDEESGEWEPVGGKYDPVTNTVRTNRLTLSQYTVMQSNKTFADVENSWAKDEINELLGKGIIDETASFNPQETITREEFTTWVARAYGVVDDEAEAPFTDLPADHEHYEELASAYNAGIVSGSGDGSFNPGAAMTKEQMSAILANAMTQYDEMKLNEGLTGTLASASDADLVSDWAGDDIAMLVELGVIDNSSGEINPQQQLTKEEAASILKKIYG